MQGRPILWPSDAVIAEAYKQTYCGRRVLALCHSLRTAREIMVWSTIFLSTHAAMNQFIYYILFRKNNNELRRIYIPMAFFIYILSANAESAYYWFSSSSCLKQCFSSDSHFLDLTARASRVLST